MTSTRSPAPSPDNDVQTKSEAWQIPDSDQEFVFESVDAAPGWIDRNWAGFDRGPALQLPAGNLDGSGPYHTKVARVGDTVKFIAGAGRQAPRFEVTAGEVPEDAGTKRAPQESAASLEDMLRSGAMSVDDLGADAKAQIATRSPHMAKMVE
jgi:hypothetical protein